MANPKFDKIDINNTSCRVMVYYQKHVLPYLNDQTKKSIRRMLLLVDTSKWVDTWTPEDVNLLVLAILFHDDSIFHQNHDLSRICVSFGSRISNIMSQYIGFTRFVHTPVVKLDRIAMNLYILMVYVNDKNDENIHRFIRKWKEYKTLDTYHLIQIQDDYGSSFA